MTSYLMLLKSTTIKVLPHWMALLLYSYGLYSVSNLRAGAVLYSLSVSLAHHTTPDILRVLRDVCWTMVYPIWILSSAAFTFWYNLPLGYFRCFRTLTSNIVFPVSSQLPSIFLKAVRMKQACVWRLHVGSPIWGVGTRCAGQGAKWEASV